MNPEISIVYEDADLLILDKSQGLPTATGSQDNLCNLLFNHRPALKEVRGYHVGEGGLLNRLDNDTGGLVLVAKSDSAFLLYSGQMSLGAVKKTYQAIVEGVPEEDSGIIRYPVAHHPKNKSRMVCAKESIRFYRGKIQTPVTHWKRIRSTGGRTLIEAVITQGVRHQIRIHLATMGYPILGDKLYNPVRYPDLLYHQLFSVTVEFNDRQGIRQTVYSKILPQF
jgi:23S rRNA pseudouridine1911/1915/1917 synthase